MKEAKQLIQSGLSKFREFQAKRKEEARRDRPSRKNFFWLMDQLQNTDKYGIPTEYVVQNPDYYVVVSCLDYVNRVVGWVSEKYIKVHQPTNIQNYEAVTEFSLVQRHSEPDDSRIIISATVYDSSDVKYKQVTYPVHATIERHQKNPYEKEPEISDLRGIVEKTGIPNLNSEDFERIIKSAYHVAHQAITKRGVPHKTEPFRLSFTGQPFQPRLI